MNHGVAKEFGYWTWRMTVTFFRSYSVRRAGIQESNARDSEGRVQALERIKHMKRRMMYLLCVPQRKLVRMLENECEGQTNKDRRTVLICRTGKTWKCGTLDS